jgi:hypothetical protein
MLSTICKTRHFTNLTKARVLKASCTTIVAGTLFVCVASVSLCAQAQIAPRRPVQKPEVPPMPQTSPPAPVFVPPSPHPQPLSWNQSGPVYPPQQVYQPPQLGSTCYAGSVSGSLAQLAPIGAPCLVLAYGIQYPGVVGQ